MKNRIVGIVSLCVPLIVGSVGAQVATPPPGPKPAAPKYVPIEQPKPAAPVTAQTPATAESDVRMGGTDPMSPGATRGKLPPLKWRSLAQVDPTTGRIQQYDMPLDIAALKPNPTVAESRVVDIMPVLSGRRYRMEQIVIDNLDFVIQVDNGLLDTLELTDPESMKLITDMVTPLVPPKSITIELFDRGVLSRVQKDFSLEIVKDYQNAMMKELGQVYGDKGLGEFMKFIMAESVKEARQAFNGMLMEASWRMDEVLTKADLTDVPGADTLRTIRGSAADTSETMAAQRHAILEAWQPWSFEQKQAFLRAVEETRQDPHAPPIPKIDATPEGAEDRTGQQELGVHPVQPKRGNPGAGSGG